MIRSFDGLALRQLRTRRLRVVLTGFGIVLGVGMVFGVLLLVGTIRHTFEDLISSAWGKSDIVVLGKANGTMPESTVTRIQRVPGVKDAGGMIGSVFVRTDARGKAIKGPKGRMFVAGFDPRHSPYDFRMIAGRNVLGGPEVILEKNWAAKRGLKVGDSVRVATPTGRSSLYVAGIFRFSNDLNWGDQGIAGMPLGTARALMDIPSGWMQIAAQATDRSKAGDVRRRVAAALGPGFDVKSPKAVGDDVANQLSALNTVLYFFSGIALFVGAFLILNAFNMTVLQRMREIGMLRTLGATRGMVVRSVLLEAMIIGAIGSVLGLLLGLGLVQGLIQLMKGFGLPIGKVAIEPGAAIAAVVVGLMATAAGALWPARRAGRVAPIRAALGDTSSSRRPSVRRGLAGLALFLPGLLLGGSYWFGSESGSGALAAVLGIGGTMLMFVGMALAAPFVIMPLARLLARPMRRLFPTGGRLAADAAGSNPSRTSATAVALTIGLSVIVVNAAVSSSFLGTISDQVDQNYARDFTVQPVGQPLETGGAPISSQVAKDVARLPGAGVVTPQRGLFFKFPRSDASQNGLAIGIDPRDFGKVDLTPIQGAPRARALADVARGGILINKAYADAAGLHTGSIVALRGPGGTHHALVAGVLKTMQGGGMQTMQMSLDTMRIVFGITTDNVLLVKARSDSARATLGRALDAYLGRSHPNLESLSTADVKDQIKSQINQQFNFFNAIIGIAVIVSLLGVINTLAMSVIERTRDIGVLRALGSSRWLVRWTMVDESLLITLSGAIAGVLVGVLIAWVWVSGMDSLLPGISFRFPVGATIGVGVAAVFLGVLASVLPARRAARLKPVEALSYE